MVTEGSVREVEEWTDEDLLGLPSEESDLYEYKSSRIDDPNLGKKLEKAGSGFWNSGGGFFIAGVDDNGNPDGGIAATVGRQSRRDWADRMISNVEPPATYAIGTVEAGEASLNIESERVVLVVAFAESPYLPHMARSFQQYFVRLGAHTDPASHFLVEALRALRAQQEPRLSHVFRFRPDQPHTVQLGIVAISDASALDVKIDLDPLPQHYQKLAKKNGSPFPLRVGVIDRSAPFFIDLALYSDPSERFTLKLAYSDALARRYETAEETEWAEGISPMTIGNPELVKIRKAVEKLVKKM